jgi:hypothetical protein
MSVIETINELSQAKDSSWVVCLSRFDPSSKTVITTVETHSFPVNDLPVARHQISRNISMLHERDSTDVITVQEKEKIEELEELKTMLE